MEEVYDDNQVKLLKSDAFEFFKRVTDSSVDVIVADPPYFLSNNGISNSGGKVVSVNKGRWDEANQEEAEKFYEKFIKESRRILQKNGTMWIFGSMHNIYTLGYLLKKNDFKILNNITWQKSNPAPNLSCRMFTHSTETILWVKKKEGKQYFNYDLMKKLNMNKQMKDVWTTSTITKKEKRFGNHPTQKPLSLIKRILQASAKSGDIVVDPFVGSGTTLVAAKKLGISALGVDSDIGFINIAYKRILNYQDEFEGNIV